MVTEKQLGFEQVKDINQTVFDLVTAFADVIELITRNIPLGLNFENDKSNNRDRRDELLDSTLIMFRKVTEYFG